MNDAFAQTEIGPETDILLQRFSQGSDAVYAYLLTLSTRLAARDGSVDITPSHVRAAAAIAVDTGFRDNGLSVVPSAAAHPASSTPAAPSPRFPFSPLPDLGPSMLAEPSPAWGQLGWTWRTSGLTTTELVARAIVVATCVAVLGYVAVFRWPFGNEHAHVSPAPAPPAAMVALPAVPPLPPPSPSPPPVAPAATPPPPPAPALPKQAAPAPAAVESLAPPQTIPAPPEPRTARPLPTPPRPTRRFATDRHGRHFGPRRDNGQAFEDLVRRFPPQSSDRDQQAQPYDAFSSLPYSDGPDREADTTPTSPDASQGELPEPH